MNNDIFFSLDFFRNYFLLTIISLIVAYFISVFSYYIVHKKRKFFNFRFSIRNYYIMTTPFLIPIIIFSFLEGTFFYIFVFSLFSVAGVIGEIIFSFLWKGYFRKPFWEYTVSTIANNFSSRLNFIPWGFGGFLFLFTERFYVYYIGNGLNTVALRESIFFIATQVALLFFVHLLLFRVIGRDVVTTLFKGRRKKNKNIRVTVKYFYFIILFLSMGLMFPIKYIDYVLLFCLFGVFAFLAEYGFGKISKIIIGKKLWRYNYLTVDKNHTTPLNIFPFGLGGYYFLFIFLILNFILDLF